MKCQICKLRKARHTYNSIKICGRCRRSTFPTPAEREADDLAAWTIGEYHAESSADCL